MPVDSIVSRIPNIRNTSTAFESLDRTARDFTAASRDPASSINARVNNNTLQSLQYPLDLGKYQFIIIEGEFININYIRFERVYRLPLPMPIQEHHRTNYDKDFNFMSILANAAQALPGQVSQLTGSLIQGGLAVEGIAVNQFKTITLRAPEFNAHTLSWKFSPKNKRESDVVRSITYGLKTGMAPGRDPTRTLFTFPKVYIMYFVPNMQYLFKFKPCVLEEVVIDFQGGNPAPAFYNSTSAAGVDYDFSTRLNESSTNQSADVTVAQSPPESVLLRTRWLELEYWIQDDFNRGGGETSTDPFSVFNWYNNGR